MSYTVHRDDVVAWLRGREWLAQNGHAPRYHAVLCDPPYFLGSIVKRFGKPDSAPAQYGSDGAYQRQSRGFMGQTWDGFESPWHYQSWVTEWATLLLSHVYPGAVLLAFGGTRTYHRLASGLEDAGWEVCDSLLWLYGSGFPKSHDISKALDREAGAEREVVGHQRLTGNACVPTKEKGGTYGVGVGTVPPQDIPITAPATPLAARWQGYGTALKPAYEPVILARAPRAPHTYAALAREFGTGAINVDGCRIGVGETWDEQQPPDISSANNAEGLMKPSDPGKSVSSAIANAGQTMSEKGKMPPDDTNKMDTGCYPGQCPEEQSGNLTGDSNLSMSNCGKLPTDQSPTDTKFTTSTGTDTTTDLTTSNSSPEQNTAAYTQYKAISSEAMKPANELAKRGNGSQPQSGRWPSNIILDDTAAAALDAMSGESVSTGGGMKDFSKSGLFMGETSPNKTDSCGFGDSGGASRFFYTAKAAAWEREAGLSKRSPHPTVKPIALTEYLARLILPPALDEPRRLLVPFAGSGSEMIGALLAGWDVVTGIEQSPEYVALAEARLAWWARFGSYEQARTAWDAEQGEQARREAERAAGVEQLSLAFANEGGTI